MKRKLFSLSIAVPLLAGTLCTLSAQATDGWTLTPSGAPVSLSGFIEDADLSGLAKAGNLVLVGSDEAVSIQLGTLDDSSGVIRFSSQIPLAPGKKKKDGGGEIDMEGVCYAAGEKAFYVTGSHGLGKKKGDVQALRFGIYRIPCDPENGTIVTEQISRSSLLPWLESSVEFKSFVRQPLQQNGFNIEGLAYAGGYLYFGVRAPVVEGRAFIIEVKADELFRGQGTGISPRVYPISLGADTGIREIAAVQGGFLILSGNAGAEASKQFPQTTARKPDADFSLSFVPSPHPGEIGQPLNLGSVSAPGGKAEGLLVLEDGAEQLKVIVLHDGLPQGGAVGYTIQRPPARK